ncbi:MAG: aminoacyl-tRNA hydrolase [Clostridia bacterium]|nr:aminoacyl-tRNA hydrolase [Clostridia bacterium]
MFGKIKEKFGSLYPPAHRPPANYEFIVAGLGNPGREYEQTRHNAGFIALDYIAQQCGADVRRLKFKSLCGDAVIDGRRVLLLKPQTFMNSSGEAIRDAAAFYKLPMEKVIVLYDDISLPPGKIRVRCKGSDGGHNGIKSILYLTGTDAFPRVKIGTGQKPRPDYDLVSWVLARPSEADRKLIAGALPDIFGALRELLSGNAAEAMNKYN